MPPASSEQPAFLRDPDPREVHYTVFSADDHLVEPPDMFRGRLPARLADRAPKVIDLEPGRELPPPGPGLPPVIAGRGQQAWEFDDQLFVQVGLNAVVGHDETLRHRVEPSSFADMRPGCYDIDARIRDMDLNGVWASVCFPSALSGFSGSVFSRAKDPLLGHAVMEASNDWMFEEWHGRHPERIVPMGVTWLADAELGAAEIRRNAARGFTAVTMPEMPHRLGFPSVHDRYWDPIFRACEETDTTLCLHVGSSGLLPLAEGPAHFEQSITFFPVMSCIAAIEWLWSGIPTRFPDLRIVLAEGGIGWVPMLLDRLDYIAAHALKSGAVEWHGELSPGEALCRSFSFCTLDEPSAMPNIHRIGVDNVLVEVDYPHADSTWPDTQQVLHDRLGGSGVLSAEDIRKLTHENAARVFRHPLPDDRLPRD